MKNKVSAFLLVLAVLAAPQASAQTRRRSTRRPARPPAAAPQSAEVRAGAERVSNQLKNITRFVYLFGRISSGIETSEQLQKDGDPRNSQTPQLTKTKNGLREGVSNVRAGLSDLESYFETTPAVRRFYPSVAGVVDSAAAAEQYVAAGQYDQAGRSLLAVANKLADALLEMK